MSDIVDDDNPYPDVDILSLYTGEKDVYRQNWDAVNQLKRESDLLAKSVISGYGASAILTLISVLNFGLFLVVGGLTTAFFSQEYIWRILRLSNVAREILEHYGDDNVVVTPRVRTGSATIDLLVRMSDRRLYALMIRSNEDRVITWNTSRQEFNVRKKGKKPKRSEPLTRAIDSLQTIADFRKTRHPIMGVSAAERNAPLIKAIVLAPGARISAPEDSTLWHEWNGVRVLKIQTTGTIYVVECKDVIKFLEPVQKKSSSAPA